MFPTLTSKRFWLQQIVAEDQPFIFDGLSHPQVVPFYGVRYSSLEATGAQMRYYNELWETKTGAWWKIVDQASGEKLGAVGYNNYQHQHHKAEIGYWLLPSYWGKGVIAEVLPILNNYLFEVVKLHRIEALIEKGNEASCKVVQKAGFQLEGTLRDFEVKNGHYISLMMYSLLSTDLAKSL